jgi:hypothetical protein
MTMKTEDRKKCKNLNVKKLALMEEETTEK